MRPIICMQIPSNREPKPTPNLKITPIQKKTLLGEVQPLQPNKLRITSQPHLSTKAVEPLIARRQAATASE